MNGDKSIYLESISPNKRWIVKFVDNGNSGFLYLYKYKPMNKEHTLIDSLWIYDRLDPPLAEDEKIAVAWNENSKRVGLFVDNECWGFLDLDRGRKMAAHRTEHELLSIDNLIWKRGLLNFEGEQLRLEHEAN